jgi:hypothetical protein
MMTSVKILTISVAVSASSVLVEREDAAEGRGLVAVQRPAIGLDQAVADGHARTDWHA